MKKFYIFTGRVRYSEVLADSEAGALDKFRQTNPDDVILFIETEEEFEEMNELYEQSFKNE